MTYLCGEWEPLHTYNEEAIETVTFHADGTATIGNEPGVWTIEQQSADYLAIGISNEEKIICSFRLHLRDGDLVADIIQYNGNNIPVYKPSHYEIISITKENWRDYFEEQLIYEEINNEFGELKHVEVGYCYLLKEEYASRIPDQLTGRDIVVERGATEISFERGNFDVQLDLENDTFTIENFEATETTSYIDDFTYYEGSCLLTRRSITVKPDSDGRDQCTEDELRMKEVIRLQFDLYLLQE